MNAFRKLLLAPALLGLVSPMAVQAQSLDMGTVDRYTQQQDIDRMRALEAQMGQVTSVSQFSDVQPTDWAYQALSNLVEQYGCVAGYPDGTFKGNIAMTRYEAAALLNACLDRVTEMTEEIKRLVKEFEKELSVLKAKVDGLEAKTAELAATQFSTTTKLKVAQYFWIGGATYSGSKQGESPYAQKGKQTNTFAAAIKSNGELMTPGMGNNFASVANSSLNAGDARIITKGATWSGATGSTGTFSTTANNNVYTGNGTYASASLANITWGTGPNNNLSPYTGGADGQLSVSGLQENGLNVGSLGFGSNLLLDGTALSAGVIKKNANPTGATFGGFSVDKNDLAALVALGNAARRVKGHDLFVYKNDVVGSTTNPDRSTMTTQGYSISTGGYFENANIYTDPYNAAIAEYGTLSKAQANTKYVKKAGQKLLKELFRGDLADTAFGEAVSFNYDTRMFFNTSFTGKDLMRIMLRAGNFADTTWGGNPFAMTGAEIAYEEGAPNNVNVNRAFYQFPVGDDFTVTAGARVRQDDMMAVWPSQYPAETIMDFFTYAGAPGTYSLNLGAGAGAWWAKDGWSVSGNYVASNGQSSFTQKGGLLNEASGGTSTAQIAYTGDEWNLTAAYAYNQNGTYGYIPLGTPLAGDPFAGLSAFDSSSVAISGWFAPSDYGDWMPSISAGWGLNTMTAKQDASIWGISAVSKDDKATSQSWYVGIQWDDAFLEGNYLGTAVGQPTFVSANDSFMETDDSTFAWELWYRFQVTDNIAVTPAFFYISNPSGLGSNSVSGGVLKTSISF